MQTFWVCSMGIRPLDLAKSHPKMDALKNNKETVRDPKPKP